MVILSQYTTNKIGLCSIPTSSLSSLPCCWVSHFAFRPATRHRLSRHPPPWRGKMSLHQRCQSTDSLHISNTNYGRQNKKTSNSPKKIPTSNIISQDKTKNPLDSQDLLQFATKKSPEVPRLKVFTLAPAPVRKRRSSLAPGILEGGFSKS